MFALACILLQVSSFAIGEARVRVNRGAQHDTVALTQLQQVRTTCMHYLVPAEVRVIMSNRTVHTYIDCFLQSVLCCVPMRYS